MPNIVQKDELQRAKVALIINVMATFVTFLSLINISNTGFNWHVVCVTIGFIIFLCLTVFVTQRYFKLQKSYREAV